jgi:hypothetical protein
MTAAGPRRQTAAEAVGHRAGARNKTGGAEVGAGTRLPSPPSHAYPLAPCRLHVRAGPIPPTGLSEDRDRATRASTPQLPLSSSNYDPDPRGGRSRTPPSGRNSTPAASIASRIAVRRCSLSPFSRRQTVCGLTTALAASYRTPIPRAARAILHCVASNSAGAIHIPGELVIRNSPITLQENVQNCNRKQCNKPSRRNSGAAENSTAPRANARVS